ncbi:MAG: hypothetical protein LBQ51_10680 [Desulfovibrio sp.]|jgi:hypothetical protein|nr:hypothetical protein [Desulfovibrio sp.]
MDATLTPQEVQHYIRRLKALETERGKGWESHWKDLSRHFLPRRARFLSAGERTNEGGPKNRMQDSIGILALRTLASGMQSGLTSPARPWFSLAFTDKALSDSPDGKDWLHDTYVKMVGLFAQSNFYDQMHILYSELACFGTAALVIEEDPESTARFRTLTAGEYCIDAAENGRVDTIYRRIRMTPRQMVQAWPESCPEAIRNRAENDSAEWITVLHAVEPNKELKRGSTRGNERPWRSAYIIIEGAGQEVLEDSGYYEFPALCPRWVVTASDIYGASPAMDALPDCRQLQKITEDARLSLELEVRPPLLVTTSLDAKLNITPGGVNYGTGVSKGESGVFPLYQTRSNLQGAKDTRMELKEQIQRHFHNDLFLMISDADKNMTATEVAERNAEKLLMLGPVLDRMRSELFRPLIDRVYGMMDRAGIIAFPPEQLTGKRIKVEFISILAQAQKQAGMAALAQTVNFAGQLAQIAQDPGVLDKLNTDEILNEFVDMQGTPPNVIRSDEETAALRAERQKQMAQQRMMEMMQRGADVADKGAKALGVLPALAAGAQGQEGARP